jgi:hypothetical protein
MVHDISSVVNVYVHFCCGTLVKVMKSMSLFPLYPSVAGLLAGIEGKSCNRHVDACALGVSLS